MSNIYDNINIVETSIIYDARTITGSAAVAANDFDLGTITFLPNVPYEDQIEVERIFDTGIDSKFDTVVFTLADRRNMFILPKGWYTINPQTKRMSISIPSDTVDDNGKYFPESRTYFTEGVSGVEVSQRVDIPDTLQFQTTTFEYTPPGASGSQQVVREPDIVIIRRKTLSKESIVTFAPGTRLTTTQLNLQFDQLKFIVQELMSRLRNEVILKYDENAIDGPFLGNTDLRMSGRFIKNLNSPSLKDIETVVGYPFESGNVIVPGAEFAVNHSRLAEALYFGTLRREGVESTAVSFTGNFSARAADLTGEFPGALTNRKIINLANGTDDTDAATFGQVKNATNISTGTLTNDVLSNIPLTKLSTTSGQSFTLPAEYLSTSGVSEGTYGTNTPSNTNNMVYMTVDAKGRVTALNHRNLSTDDLPNTTVNAQTYGQSTANSTNNMVSFTVDAKGRLTSASQRSLLNADLPTSGVTSGTYGAESGTGTNTLTRFTVDNKGIITGASHRSIEVNDLPTTSVTGAGTYGQASANNSNNMLRVTYDAKGRVTSIDHRNMGYNDLPNDIPLTKLSEALSQGYTLPKDAIADGSILFAKLDTTTPGQGTIPLTFIPNNIPLEKIDAGTPGSFELPVNSLPSTGTAGTYGDTQPALTIVTDNKGRVSSITPRNLTATDIPSLDAAKITTGTFDAGRIPTSVVTNNALAWDSGNSVYTANNGTNRRIANVADPANAQDVVTKNYLEANALVATGGVITAGGSRLTGLGTPAPGTAIGSDAVNFALLESVVLTNAQASGQLVGSTLPQVYRSAAPSPTTNNPTTGWNRYAFAFVDGTNPLYATTSTMVIVEIEGSSIKCVPQTAAPTSGTVFNGWFYLDISGSTKTVYLYTNTSITGTNVIIRNFGLSRLVSGALATTASTGLVSIAAGNDGGINVDGVGAISLKQATASQIGGIKQGTGLTISSGVASVNLTDNINSTSSSTAASAKAVNTLRLASMLLDGSQQMTGKLSFVAPASGRASMLLPSAALDPSTLVDGDLWHNNGILKFRSAGTTKTIAFIGDNAATATTLQNSRTFSITGAVTATGVSFNGSSNVTLNTSPAADSIILGTHTTGNYVASVSAGTGISLSGSAGEGTTFTVTNSDRGSSQNIFKTVTAGGTGVTANTNSTNLTLSAGSGISLTGDDSTKTITITNTATPPNTFGTVAVAGTSLIADSSTDTLTINQGTGITLTANAGSDTFTIANAGVTSLAGTADQVNVSASTGAVTLSLPQAIHTAATPTFGSVTAKNLTFGNINNTIISTNTDGNINLDPNGAGIVNVQSPLDVDSTLNVDGATTLVGNVTINSPSTLTLLNSEGKISLGAVSSTTSINRQVSTTGILRVGDLILRVPTTGKAWLVPNDTTTTTPVAANEIITQGSLTTALGSYATTASLGTYMTFAGGLNAGAQALGTSNASSFTVATNNVTRVTVGSAGGLTVNSGNLSVTDGNITIGGSTGKVVAAASTVASDSAKTLASKDYVDSKKWNYVFFTSGSGTWTSPANVTEVEVFMAGGGAAGLDGGNLYNRVGKHGAMVNFTATIASNTNYNYVVGVGGTAPLGSGAAATSTTFLGVTATGGTTWSTITTSAEVYAYKQTYSSVSATGVSNLKINRWVEATLTTPELPFTGMVGYYWLLTDSFKYQLQQDADALKYFRAAATGSTAPLTWSIGNIHIPGAGGQSETCGSCNNYVGGVGGVIMIKYWG